ncbi:MAG: hypothetical protein ABIG90_03715 [bacterium]
MRSKSIITIIFSIIGIIFIAIAVYAAAVKKDSDSEKYQDLVPYENKDAGFGVMIPKSFVVYEDKIEHPRENQYPKEIIFASKPRPERPDSSLDFYTGEYAVIVNSGDNPLGLSLDEWMKKNIHPNLLKHISRQKKQQLKVDQYEALLVESDIGELYSWDVHFVTKDKYFSFVLIPRLNEKEIARYPEHKDSLKTLYLMLESFKLIEKPE